MKAYLMGMKKKTAKQSKTAEEFYGGLLQYIVATSSHYVL